MRTTIKTNNEAGEKREIELCDEIHNQGVRLYDSENVELHEEKTGAAFLEQCPETLNITDAEIAHVRAFDSLHE